MFVFKEFDALKKQLDGGLITEAAFLLKVQLSPEQVGHLVALNSLPYKAAAKLSISDLDGDRLLG